MDVQPSLKSEVPSPSLSGHPFLSTVELPAAYKQSSTESSTPSPSASAAEASGKESMDTIKNARNKERDLREAIGPRYIA